MKYEVISMNYAFKNRKEKVQKVIYFIEVLRMFPSQECELRLTCFCKVIFAMYLSMDFTRFPSSLKSVVFSQL